MKVLHVSGARSWGGNEQQLLYLVEELAKHEVDQVLFCYENTPLHQKAKGLPVTIKSIHKSKPYSSTYTKALAKIVKKEGVDLIHLHTSDSVTGFMVTDMFHSLNTPTVFAKKGISSNVSTLSKIKYNYRNINRIICVSEYVKKNFVPYIKEKNRHKLVTVYDGVKEEALPAAATFNLRDKLKLSKDTFLIGNIANHTNAKDLPTLIAMVDQLVNKMYLKDIFVVQIGEFSKLTPNLELLVKQHGLEPYFRFMGFQENASSFLPQFDVFVMTSSREGGPTSVLEAFFKKTPVISTRVGVVEEAIQDGVNGYVANLGDSKTLAEKLVHFKNDPSLGKSFSERSYQLFIDKFTAQRFGEKTYEVYKDVFNETK